MPFAKETIPNGWNLIPNIRKIPVKKSIKPSKNNPIDLIPNFLNVKLINLLMDIDSIEPPKKKKKYKSMKKGYKRRHNVIRLE